MALTRARLSATLITIAHKESPFVTELVDEQQLEVVNADGSASTGEVCRFAERDSWCREKGATETFLAAAPSPDVCSRERAKAMARCAFARSRFAVYAWFARSAFARRRSYEYFESGKAAINARLACSKLSRWPPIP